MILDREQFDTKEDFFWFIYNNLGCSDLTLCYSYIKKDGSLGFSKWITYEQLLNLSFDDKVPGTFDTRQQFIKKISHRNVLDIEIMMDIDDKGKFKSIKNKAKSICKRLNKNNLEYTCYFTGSKSYHISLIFPQLRYEQKNKELILNSNKFKADIQKAGKRCMIALEGEPHYKSGKIKRKVDLIGK